MGYAFDFSWINLPVFDGTATRSKSTVGRNFPDFILSACIGSTNASREYCWGRGRCGICRGRYCEAGVGLKPLGSGAECKENGRGDPKGLTKTSMAKRYTRQEFLDRLRAEIGRGKPLVMTGAGNGIAAKFIERGGVDILGVYNTGYFRMQGYGSLAGMLPMADANEMVLQHWTPRSSAAGARGARDCGVNGVDVLRDMKLFLEDCKRIGFSGVHNFPDGGVVRWRFSQDARSDGAGLSTRN